MPYAKVTSKGQVTIPAEVRRLLALDTGDSIVLEPHGEYVVMRKAPALGDVLDELAARYPVGEPRFSSADEALAAHARERANAPTAPLRIVGGRARAEGSGTR